MKTNHRKWSNALLLLILICNSLLARAGGGGGFGSFGGGGGGFSGSSGGGSGFELLLMILAIPFIIFAIIASIVMAIKHHNAMYNSLKDAEAELEVDGLPEFLSNHAEFNPKRFKKNVQKIFIDVQKGWSRQDLGKVRRYLSDGVWQRFHTQFDMMGHLQQENKISQLFVYKTALVGIEEEGAFDIIHVGIMASCKDIFITGADDTGRGGREKFIEYWSFIRRKECNSKFTFDRKCPSCDATLPKELGEYAFCKHCDSLINNGEHDWVLSEITQASEWEERKSDDNSAVIEQCENLTRDVPDFSRQLIEDKASNAFMQILGAIASKDSKRVKHFLTDELYDHINYSQMDDQPNLYFNHLYLKDASVSGIERTNEFDIVTIRLKASFQRVYFTGLGLQSVDGRAMTVTQGIEMSRNRGTAGSKFSLYAQRCPACGGPIKSVDSDSCEYCQSKLNSPAAEWIVSDLINGSGKRMMVTERASAFSLKESDLEDMGRIKSVVMNNLLVLAYADSDFSQREKRFIDELGRKLNYSRASLDALRGDAARGALSLRIPESKKDKKAVLSMMKKFAFADEELSVEEIAVMKEFEESIESIEVQEFDISF